MRPHDDSGDGDALQVFLNGIGTYRLLRPAEELELARRIEQGDDDVAAAVADGIAQLGRAGFTKVDYVEAVDAETLAPFSRGDRPGRILAAAWLGRTRLIDNVPLEPTG